MNPTFIDRPNPIQFLIADRKQSLSDLRIELHEAPKTPSLGSVSTQVGEAALSQAVSEQSTLLVSLGKDIEITPEIFRQAGGGLARWLLKSGVEQADLNLDPAYDRSQAHVSALLEGILLGAYQFNQYKISQECPPIIYHQSPVNAHRFISAGR